MRAVGNVRLLYQGPSNENGAFMGGIEVAAQYSFTQRPSPWGGFGVILNHTWVDTDAEFISPSSGVAFNVPGLSRNTTNAVIFYEIEPSERPDCVREQEYPFVDVCAPTGFVAPAQLSGSDVLRDAAARLPLPRRTSPHSPSADGPAWPAGRPPCADSGSVQPARLGRATAR